MHNSHLITEIQSWSMGKLISHTFWNWTEFDNSLLLQMTLSVVSTLDRWSESCWFCCSSLFELSIHERILSGTNSGTGTPNTFFVNVTGSVVSVGNRSKFNRKTDTGDKSSFTLLLSLKNLLKFIMFAEFSMEDLNEMFFYLRSELIIWHWNVCMKMPPPLGIHKHKHVSTREGGELH